MPAEAWRRASDRHAGADRWLGRRPDARRDEEKSRPAFAAQRAGFQRRADHAIQAAELGQLRQPRLPPPRESRRSRPRARSLAARLVRTVTAINRGRVRRAAQRFARRLAASHAPAQRMHVQHPHSECQPPLCKPVRPYWGCRETSSPGRYRSRVRTSCSTSAGASRGEQLLAHLQPAQIGREATREGRAPAASGKSRATMILGVAHARASSLMRPSPSLRCAAVDRSPSHDRRGSANRTGEP